MKRYITVELKYPRYYIKDELPDIIEKIELEHPEYKFVQLFPETMSRMGYVLMKLRPMADAEQELMARRLECAKALMDGGLFSNEWLSKTFPGIKF